MEFLLLSWVGIVMFLTVVAIVATVGVVAKNRRGGEKSQKVNDGVDTHRTVPVYLKYKEQIRVHIRSKKGKGSLIPGRLVGYMVNWRGEETLALVETTRGGTPARRDVNEVYPVYP